MNHLQSCFSSESSPHPIKSHPIPLETGLSTVISNSVLTRQVEQGMVLPNWEAPGLDCAGKGSWAAPISTCIGIQAGVSISHRGWPGFMDLVSPPTCRENTQSVGIAVCVLEGMAGEQPGCQEKLG